MIRHRNEEINGKYRSRKSSEGRASMEGEGDEIANGAPAASTLANALRRWRWRLRANALACCTRFFFFFFFLPSSKNQNNRRNGVK
jgi:hypothetical protein